jgi:V-type H+-transporting ATPase subunit a
LPSDTEENAFEETIDALAGPDADEEFLQKIIGKKSHHFDFGECMIHQVIETIEFVLGTISNTASYLRLWALSLAHGQLAKVFFSKLMLPALQSGSAWKIFMAFPIWASVTFGVLLCMDTMECFLHVLRLHWVEFQSKFYKGEGYEFKPLDFKLQQ